MEGAPRGGAHVTIVANIGSGKTTLTDLLRQVTFDRRLATFHVVIVGEPVENWRNFDGKGANLLEAFYNDMPTYAGYMQLAAGESKIKAIEAQYQGEPGKICISDTSILSDHEVFTPALRESGDMGAIPFRIYDQQFNRWMTQQPYLRPNAFIYLKTNPLTCRQRVLKRGRAEEIEKVTFLYLGLLHKHFERWISTIDPIDILTLDGDQDFEGDPKIANDFVGRIESFLSTLVDA
jgi:deoxyadenosine/deoxycytidine kinase